MAKPSKPIGTNPSVLNWPTDRWGLTKDLKQALILLSSRLAGHPDKKELFDETLRVGLEFLEAKFKQDTLLRNKRIADAEVLRAQEQETQDEADKRDQEQQSRQLGLQSEKLLEGSTRY